MKYIIYISTAVQLYNDAELKALLRESQAYNLLNNVTGMLLYSSYTFIQAIEGDDNEIDSLYKKIIKDRRHKNIIKVAEDVITERIFPYWSMGFKMASANEISKFDAYIPPKLHVSLNSGEKHPAIIILKTFADNNAF